MSRVKEFKKYLNGAVFRGGQNLFLFRLRRDFFLLEQKDSKWNDYHYFKHKHILTFEESVSRVTELKKYLNDVVSRSRGNLFLFRLGWYFFLLEKKDSIWNDYHSFKDKHIFLLDENMSRVTELKKYLHDVVVRGRQNLFLSCLGKDLFLLEQKDSKWNDYHPFKDKHIFLLDENVSRVKGFNNTLTMLSSEVDRICSSSVREETCFCWKKERREMIPELIIILLKASTFSYWRTTCHVRQILHHTLTMLSSEDDRICSSSVWEETSFCWKEKTVNEMIIILLNTRTFSY